MRQSLSYTTSHHLPQNIHLCSVTVDDRTACSGAENAKQETKMKFTPVVIILVLSIFESCLGANDDKKIVRARLESCPGCSLNRLPDVKSFFYEDVPTYTNVEWKKISGAPPELIFLNEADEEVERHLLGRLSREECNNLLQSKGFTPTKGNKEL